MESSHLYQQIVESIRDDILSGVIKPGASLPPMRKMTEQWGCTTGPIMRAYQELAHQGLVVSHVGKGTKVVEQLPEQTQNPMRRAALFNRMEAFLLEIMTAGYSPDEVEQSLRVALDRWRTFSSTPEETPPNILRFVGSHDPSLALIASQYHENNPKLSLHLSFTGSLGGLIALAEKKADLAGCHLWDENTDTYNESFIRKLLPGQKVAMLTLAHRRVGLILPEGNPILGVEFMIQTEINSSTLCKNLDSSFGRLTAEETEQLLNLYFFTHKMGHDSEILGNTETGTHRYDADSMIVEYKKIEFENSQIISEPVDDMRGYLEAIPRVRMAMDEYTNQFKKLAASTKEINVARLVPVTSEILHGDNNISVAINRYEEVGYYFNVVVASEVCPDTFRFIVSNRADVSKSLVLAGNKPGEHFFSFYKEFSSGIYDVTIETEAGVILSSEFMIELEAE